METNFFSSIVALQVVGDWKINIAKQATGILVVSVLFYNEAIGDDARKVAPPILLRGTPQELDEGFFNAIGQPVKETAQLFLNMEQYLKAKETAKTKSQMEKDKSLKADKGVNDKEKKYDEAMEKADALEAEGKYKEAWMKVPSVQEYPQHAESIRSRKATLSAQFAPDLFNEPKPE